MVAAQRAYPLEDSGSTTSASFELEDVLILHLLLPPTVRRGRECPGSLSLSVNGSGFGY